MRATVSGAFVSRAASGKGAPALDSQTGPYEVQTGRPSAFQREAPPLLRSWRLACVIEVRMTQIIVMGVADTSATRWVASMTPVPPEPGFLAPGRQPPRCHVAPSAMR